MVCTCNNAKTPVDYKPKSLPYSKYMTGQELHSDLQLTFQGYGKITKKPVEKTRQNLEQ